MSCRDPLQVVIQPLLARAEKVNMKREKVPRGRREKAKAVRGHPPSLIGRYTTNATSTHVPHILEWIGNPKGEVVPTQVVEESLPLRILKTRR